MGEWVRVNIDIGGPLPRSKIPRLVAAFGQDDGLETWEGVDCRPKNEEELLKLVDDRYGYLSLSGEANYGNFYILTQVCRELGLSYVHWSASTCDADACFCWWTPDYDDELTCLSTDTEHERAYEKRELEAIKMYLDENQPGKALKEIEFLLSWRPEIPNLEITDA